MYMADKLFLQAWEIFCLARKIGDVWYWGRGEANRGRGLSVVNNGDMCGVLQNLEVSLIYFVRFRIFPLKNFLFYHNGRKNENFYVSLPH